MANLFNRVKFTTTTTGTGTLTVGSAVSGFRTPAQAGVADGTIASYVIEDGAAWETGQGTYTVSGTTLSRTVRQSSNSDNAINLSGSAIVKLTVLAEELSGHRELITTSSPSGTGTVTFSSIPQYYNHLEIWIVGRSTKSDVYETLDIEFNGDTNGTNYRYAVNEVYATGSGATAEADGRIIMSLAGGNSPANTAGHGKIDIPFYTSGFRKGCFSLSATRFDDSSSFLIGDAHWVEWENTAAITQVDLKLATGNYASGTKINLYGIF